MKSWLDALGKGCTRYCKTVIALWLILVLALAYYAVQLPSVLKGNGFVMDGSYAQVNEILEAKFGVYASTLLLVLDGAPHGDEAQLREDVAKTAQRVMALELEGLRDAAGPYPAGGLRLDPTMAKNGVAYLALGFAVPSRDMGPAISAVRGAVTGLAAEGVPVALTGAPVIEQDLNTASQEDLARAEMIGLPVAMLVLLLAFGGLVAAALPLFVGVVSVAVTMGLLYFLGMQIQLSIFLLNVVVMLGLALGIDFALLFVNRFRQELARGSTEAAVRKTVRTAGESILFSGLCVFVGLAAMAVIRVDIFQVIAIGGMTVVFLSMLAALTLLPALLALLGDRVNRLMVRRARRPQRLDIGSDDPAATIHHASAGRESGWIRFSRMVMRRPLLMAICAFALLLICLVPVRNMVLSVPDTDALPPHYDSRTAYERYEQIFLEPDAAHVLMLARLDGQGGADMRQSKQSLTTLPDQGALSRLYRLHTQLTEDNQVAKVQSVLTSPSGTPFTPEQWLALAGSPESAHQLAPALERLMRDNLALLRIELTSGPNDAETKAWVRTHDDRMADIPVQIGGYPKFNQEIFDEIAAKVGYSLALILGATYIILFLAFRSVLIPLKAILMNALSLCATFGILVWLFQEGHFGMEPSAIALFIPIFIFSIVFGLSTDYEVFLISRMQEIYEESGDNDRATLEGLTHTSKIITSAAAIMIVITGAFAFTGVMPVKQLGVGIALAILIDATIVRMVLVPSMMRLLGKWNWWAPRMLRRRKRG
ncbi:MMPL family transporter [Paenibacillus sp. IB182496]|uniref:MMPL family transporter n=1 Tax=Paenibacillus sabuli TaxID=2772509 RepID=A0A927BUM2_9BACL|nr:MMPL family transporter [Paenibacillus sabuli]MBD2845799.1 MMPL family transporter [Paenibacillus sabuli]